MPNIESLLRRALFAFGLSTTIIASGLALCGKAHADQEEVAGVAAALLMQIGAAYPQYDIPPVPQIHLLSTSKEIKARCGVGIYACAAMTADGTVHIFLPSHLDFTEREAQAILIHELTHAVQWKNGQLPDRALENEARKAERLVNGRRQ